ncbi:MAG: hypothetical protein KBD15_02690 [Candidatus Magasanikbacteria bacterium]|jgi:BMFP domain-containing protein YqiC|nr:hypothetical protein [Candidatus Magasanikbacteria bacterium]
MIGDNQKRDNLPKQTKTTNEIPADSLQKERPTFSIPQESHEGAPLAAEYDKAVEQQTEQGEGAPYEKNIESNIDILKRKLRKQKKQQHTSIPQVRDALTVEVERVLEEGLSEAFQALTPIQREEFKIKGEETAFEIRKLMKGTHIKIKKIFFLIISWLRLLPGINRFFLEQEAKIKVDRIIALKEKMDHRQK